MKWTIYMYQFSNTYLLHCQFLEYGVPRGFIPYVCWYMTVILCTSYTVPFKSGTTRKEAENCLYWENSFSVCVVWLTRKYRLGVHSTIERSMLPGVMRCGRRWGDLPDVWESVFFFLFSVQTNTFIWPLRQKSNDVNLNMNSSCSTGPRRHIKP